MTKREVKCKSSAAQIVYNGGGDHCDVGHGEGAHCEHSHHSDGVHGDGIGDRLKKERIDNHL